MPVRKVDITIEFTPTKFLKANSQELAFFLYLWHSNFEYSPSIFSKDEKIRFDNQSFSQC